MDLSNLPNNLKRITLNEQTNYRIMEIGKITDYFNQEIKYQQTLTSKLSKYLTCSDYAGKNLTVFLTVLVELMSLLMLEKESNFLV